jgi:hypothetical protein
MSAFSVIKATGPSLTCASSFRDVADALISSTASSNGDVIEAFVAPFLLRHCIN